MTKTFVQIQMANTPSGQNDVNTPLPRPFFLTQDGTSKVRRMGWDEKIIGFSKTSEPGSIDLLWEEFAENVSIESVRGMFPVFVLDGEISTAILPVSSLKVLENEEN